MSTSTFALIAAAVGLPSLLGTIVKGILDWINGKGEREKREFREAVTWTQYSMKLWETALKLRATAIEHGIPADKLPEIPSPPFTPDK